MKKLLFTLALFIGLKSFGQVTAHNVLEIVIKDPNGNLVTFYHKDKEHWESQTKDTDGGIIKMLFTEMDEITDHSLFLEIKEIGIKAKFDLATKKVMMYQADPATKKYPETSQMSAEIVSFK